MSFHTKHALLALTLSVALFSWAESPMQQANNFYNAKQYNQSIDILEHLYLESPEDSGVINNLAANYIARGITFNNTQKNYAAAANDFRKGLYLLRYEWPNDLTKSKLAVQNENNVEANLLEVLGAMKAPVKDANWHLAQAKTLRAKGQLPEAFVEYAWVSQLQNLNATAAKAWEGQGDIYTVRRRYDKALSAYQQAVYHIGEDLSPALQIKLATAYEHNEQPDKSATIYADILEKDPSNIDALMAMEQLYITELRSNPNNIEAHINLGSVYEHQKRLAEAEREYQEAFKRDPKNQQLKLNFASLAMAQGNTPRAMTIYDDLLSTNPNDETILRYKADLLTQQGQTEPALAILKRLLVVSNDKKPIVDSMLSLATSSKNPALLRETWQNYASSEPNDAKVQYEAGVVFHQLKAYPEAIAYYQKAVALDPKLAEAYANLGSALSASNQTAAAQQALAKAVQLNPKLEQAKALNQSLSEGQLQEKLKAAVEALNTQRYEQAVTLYSQLIQQHSLAANQADIQAQYGLALQGNKQYDLALTAFSKASSLDTKRGEFVFYKARLLDGQGKGAEAKPLYEKALTLDPSLTDAQQALGNLKQRLAQQATQQIETLLGDAYSAYDAKQYAKAITLSDQVLKRDPQTSQNAMAHYYKGLALEASNLPQKALVEYQAAVATAPDLSDALYAQAVLLDTMGQKIPAKKAFQSFLLKAEAQGKSDDEFVQYARTRITQL